MGSQELGKAAAASLYFLTGKKKNSKFKFIVMQMIGLGKQILRTPDH